MYHRVNFPVHFCSFSLQFGGVLAVVMSKEKKGLALVEFSNVMAAVSVLTASTATCSLAS